MATRVSIVLEWDNAVVGGTDRARRVLDALGAQVVELDPDIEVLIVFDDSMIDGATMHQIVSEHLPTDLATTLVPHRGSRYYEQKNIGGMRARGEILVFLDSDTLPEDRWLTEIVRAFDDPTVQVAAGQVSTGYASFAGKAFALTWNFPLRTNDGPPHPTHHFNANTVAFRRSIFDRHPFRLDARFRGPCHTLAEELTANGIEILAIPNARAIHPAPSGFVYVIQRALCQGHDRLLTYRMRGTRAPFLHSLKVLGSDVKGSVTRVARLHRDVDLPVWQVPAAIAVAAWYYTWSWLGCVTTMIRPTFIRRRFRV